MNKTNSPVKGSDDTQAPSINVEGVAELPGKDGITLEEEFG